MLYCWTTFVATVLSIIYLNHRMSKWYFSRPILRYSTTSTPYSTFLPPHSPASPASAPITTDSDHMISVLRLPQTILIAQNVPLLKTSSPTSIASNLDVQHAQPWILYLQLLQANTTLLWPRISQHLLATDRNPILIRSTSECILVPNSRRGYATSLYPPDQSAFYSATRAQDLPIIESASSDTGKRYWLYLRFRMLHHL